MNVQESTGQAIKNSAVISVFNALGFASALLIDIVVAARFGLGEDVDAFFIAFTIPSLTASILLVASNVALVPIFTKVVTKDGKSSLWRTSSNLANLGLLMLSLFGIVGSLSSPLLIRVMGAGLDASSRELAISLSVYLFLMVIPLGAVEVFKATLNSLRSFAFPAAAALVRNSVTFLMVVLFNQRLGIKSLALGYVIATWLQLAFLGIVLRFRGFHYHFVLNWRESRTVEALGQIRHPLAGAVLGQSNIVIERFLASFLPVGLVSALSYARRIYAAIDQVFLGSISTAFLPRLSAQSTRDRLAEFKRTLLVALKLAVFFSVPIAVGIITLSEPVVSLLLRRGAFDLDATRTTARLLSLYILGIPSMALFRVLRASFYASGDTKTPFYTRVLMLGFNVVFDLVLFSILGVVGLALALTLSQAIVVVLLAWLLYRRIGSLGSDVLSFVSKIGLAAVLMGGTIFGLQRVFTANSGPSHLFGVAFWGVLGSGVYVLLLLVLRLREIRLVVDVARVRFHPGKKLRD